MLYDFVVRRSDGQITGIFAANENWTEEELSSGKLWIIRKELTETFASEISDNHWRAVGSPAGQISGNIYSDIQLEAISEELWQ